MTKKENHLRHDVRERRSSNITQEEVVAVMLDRQQYSIDFVESVTIPVMFGRSVTSVPPRQIGDRDAGEQWQWFRELVTTRKDSTKQEST